MSKRKEQKPQVFHTMLWNPPKGKGEINNEPTVVIDEQDTSAEVILAKYLRGEMLVNKEGRYDAPNVADIPANRKKGAGIPSVTNAIKDVLVKDVIAKDIASRTPKKDLSNATPDSIPDKSKDSKES